MKTGEAFLPLHDGVAPSWLLEKMKRLASLLVEAIIELYGTEELLRRLSDPFWFQSFGCLLGFDWHSSGLTTTTCAAIKEGLQGKEKALGFFAAGGKGQRALKTPEEIVCWASLVGVDGDSIVLASRLSAKVDNVALQDGYSLYQHMIFFNSKGNWTVIQQGMNLDLMYARRYHWLSLDLKDFVNEPHSGIASPIKHDKVLNLVASESAGNREATLEVVKDAGLREIKRLFLSRDNPILSFCDMDPKRFLKKLEELKWLEPGDFKELLLVKGLGAKTLRALSLTAELLTGKSPSYRDPVRYAYAHGGKDGYPFPVDRETYSKTIDMLEKIVRRAELSLVEKEKLFRKLSLIF
ncbi:MAG: DUF763 domain-containing protein [Synergistetes bacterium]|nr:DUF763 domain-containing protein [Synergistota bacterium]MCX8127430.1 DUF763 domain-containing protein [Synergistota bacterium]MDW8192294.1 DUF763 domain-containing protein [Synergistota bacterium]